MCAVREAPSVGPGGVLLTGAAGAVGSLLRAPLARLGAIRLADLVAPTPGPGDDQVVVGDLADPDVADLAVDGVDAIVHLAAYPRPDAPWDVLVDANLRTTAALLDAAARHGVRRLVLASSVHAAGGWNDPADWPVDVDRPARPCCRYGVSKAAGELLLRAHADQEPAASAVALRLGLVADLPRWAEEVRGWTPPADLGPLVAGALRAGPGYQVHFAVTAADRPRYRTDGLRAAFGHDSRAADHLAHLDRPLGHVPPAYFPGCVLWARHLTIASPANNA